MANNHLLTWEELKPQLNQLLDQPIGSVNDLKNWLQKKDQLESEISEDMAWRYIRMTCHTDNKTYEQNYLDFVQNIQPQLAPLDDKLNKKALEGNFYQSLKKESRAYEILFDAIETGIALYREENIPIHTELATLSQKYSALNGAMSIEWEGKELTLQQAAVLLKDNNRTVRKAVYEKITARRLQDKDQLEDLFSQMVKLRHQIALNAGFDNYRDYKFKSMNRVDYTPQDCFDFHKAIAEQVVPIQREVLKIQQEKLGLDVLKPYDTAVEPGEFKPLKPFEKGEELLKQTQDCLAKIDPYFSECLLTMEKMEHLDLESRKGKSPGGYNYPLMKTGVPFIFMNAAGTMRDVETLVHEAGHAVHSFLTANLPLGAFKNTPSEVAELASMSMELLALPHLNSFLKTEEEVRRARVQQLEGIISTLPWIAIVDKFQHWIYTNPSHSPEERKSAWLEINKEFGSGMVDYSEYPDALAFAWHKQLHIFEIPFYYIEYGFAQLGAIGVWKNATENKEKALEQYKDALKLGHMKGIPEVYQTAGIQFDFSANYIQNLFKFVNQAYQDYNA